jgi:hypothetical protein
MPVTLRRAFPPRRRLPDRSQRPGRGGAGRAGPLTAGAPADRLVQIRVVEREGDRPAPARLHLHGAAGEYLAPVDRHRIINPMWFEDPGTEAVLLDHSCAYTSGVATARVPLGEIFIEVTRGPEYCPLRQTFTFDEWMDAVRRGETFATFGPLVGLSVDGKPIGSQIDLPASGRSVELSWYVASATIPMSRVELVISGTVVRGEPEVILTHTSPIVITVDRLPLFSKPDATTILDQIEGSLIYLDSIAIRPDMATHARMVATLEGARKKLKERIDRVPGG